MKKIVNIFITQLLFLCLFFAASYLKPVSANHSATNLQVPFQECVSGAVRTSFAWTPIPDVPGFTVKDQQWLDVSLDPNMVSFLGANVLGRGTYTTTTAGGQNIGHLAPNKIHYWRINTHIAFEPPGTWHTSPIFSFTTINCSVLPPPAGSTFTVWAIVPGCTGGLSCFKGVATGVTGTSYTFNSSNSTITKNTNYSVTVCAGDCATNPALAGWPKTCQASDFTTLVVDWGNTFCTGEGTTPAGCANADLNGDGTIDVADQQEVAFNVGGTYNAKYDFNGDGVVDTDDVIFIESCFSPLPPYTGTGGAGCEGFLDCMTGIKSPTDQFNETGLVGAIFSSILPIIIGLGGFLTVILIVVSGIQFVTSSGNPEAAAAARGRLTFAIIGFALLVLAFAITQIIDNIFLRGSGAF